MANTPARTLSDRFTLRWDAEMGCYRVSIPNLEGPIEVVPATDYDALRGRAERAEAERDRYREALRELAAAVESRSGASSRGGQWSIHYLTSQWDRLMDAREHADKVIRSAFDDSQIDPEGQEA